MTAESNGVEADPSESVTEVTTDEKPKPKGSVVKSAKIRMKVRL